MRRKEYHGRGGGLVLEKKAASRNLGKTSCKASQIWLKHFLFTSSKLKQLFGLQLPHFENKYSITSFKGLLRTDLSQAAINRMTCTPQMVNISCSPHIFHQP